jgi:hypothetical protein
LFYYFGNLVSTNFENASCETKEAYESIQKRRKEEKQSAPARTMKRVTEDSINFGNEKKSPKRRSKDENSSSEPPKGRYNEMRVKIMRLRKTSEIEASNDCPIFIKIGTVY